MEWQRPVYRSDVEWNSWQNLECEGYFKKPASTATGMEANPPQMATAKSRPTNVNNGRVRGVVNPSVWKRLETP
jgi:hypothetical protein